MKDLSIRVRDHTAVDGWQWVEIEHEDDDWIALYHVGKQDGNLVIDEIRFLGKPQNAAERKWLDEQELRPARQRPPPPPGGLTARGVRDRLAVRHALDAMRKTLWRLPDDYLMAFHGLTREALNERAGGRRHNPRLYAQLANLYVYATQRGSRRPVEDVVAELNRTAPNGTLWEAPQVRNLIHRARRHGYLTPAEPGRPGGELTDKATAVLEAIR